MRRKRVIAVLCVALVLGCAGWLIPAIGRVREAAARSKCHGNLKYLAVALHAYADVNGGITATIRLPGVPPDRRLSWVVGLLPYIEQHPAFKRFDLALPADADPNVAAADTRLHGSHCPSSGRSDWNGGQTPGLVMHYVGVAGVGADAAALSEGPRAGAFGYDRRTPIPGGFPDGTGNTFLLAETAHAPAHWAVGGPGTVRPFVPNEAPYIGPGRPFGGFHAADLKLFWSSGTMMNVAMADGSIRTVRGDIDPAVLEALATVNGRESLSPEW